MRVFVTGGSGWIGSHLVPELITNGHTVLALARSDASAAKLRSLVPASHDSSALTILTGDLTDTAVLQRGARDADAVAHLGFIHDYANFGHSLVTDSAAVSAMADALAESASGKAFITTTGSMMPGHTGQPLPETHRQPSVSRGASENTTLDAAQRGVRGMSVRLGASVHGKGDPQFIPAIIGVSKKLGYVPYVDAASRWPVVHVKDAAVLYRLALEKGKPGAVYHAAAENVKTKDFAELIAKRSGSEAKQITREDAGKELGFIGMALGTDMPLSAEQTKAELGWEPKHPGLLEDMEANYF